jgi:hypothetical protein
MTVMRFSGLATVEPTNGEPPWPDRPDRPPIIDYPPPIHPPDNDIRSILEQPGGPEPVIVKAGEYVAGPGCFPHDERLVVVAEHPGEVMLNLAGADLHLDYGSSRIALCGFASKDGTVVSNGDDITLWYHDARWPIEVWHQHYLAALGKPEDQATDDEKRNAIARMAQPTPKGILIGDFQNIPAGAQVGVNRVLGSDVHDCGDDGVFVDKCAYALVRGARIYNIEEKGLDPGVNPWAPGDMFHNDAVQTPGTVSDLQVLDSYVQNVLQLGGDNGNLVGTIARLWVAGCAGSGAVVISNHGPSTKLTVADVLGFSNGMAYQHDDGWNSFMTEFGDDRQIIAWGPEPVTSFQGGTVGAGHFEVPDKLMVIDAGGNRDKISPAELGFATNAAGYLEDHLAPLNDPDNPALLWRHAHPFDEWRLLLAGGVGRRRR